MHLPFRVELLHTEKLPRQILRSLPPGLEGRDPELLRAAEEHLTRVETLGAKLRDIDFPKQKVEQNLFISKGLRGLSLEELGRAEQVERRLTDFQLGCDELNSRFFSLAAARFFAASSSREEILRALEQQSWATQHEILTRWRWMASHRSLMKGKKRKVLERAYSCELSSLGAAEREVDVEFNTYLRFLHHLRHQDGRELLFFEKTETPDFVAVAADCSKLGIEVTQAAVADQWYEEQKAERRVKERAWTLVSERPLTVRFIHGKDWKSWDTFENRWPEVETWLRGELERPGHQRGGVDVRRCRFEGVLEVEVTEGGPTDIDWRSEIPAGDSVVEGAAECLRRGLQERIQKKIEKDGRPCPRPSVRPCYLVVYPNHELFDDLERVIRRFFEHPPIDVQSHFDEVWLCDEFRAARLV